MAIKLNNRVFTVQPRTQKKKNIRSVIKYHPHDTHSHEPPQIIIKARHSPVEYHEYSHSTDDDYTP